ncbi:ATP-binding protein [Candidatus Calescamantes bacterium]|nr:ATP-binding protein [Candidatus Calescamantes bacterium]
MEKLIERDLFPEIFHHLFQPEITLLVGARQVGKTVLLKMLKDALIKEGIPESNILYFNLDIISDWEFFQSQREFIQFLRERSSKGKIFVFVDEAQRVPESARFFKGVYDSNLNIKLVLTGSASLELKTRFKESLTGRKRIFHLHPFSFKEYLKAKDPALIETLNIPSPSPLTQKRFLSFIEEYCRWGGYPRVVFSENSEERIHLLTEIYTSYIDKDIVGFLQIKNKLAFSRLVKLLSAQIGQLVNITELSSSLNLDRGTVERYIQALQETYIITPLYPYFRNPRQEIVKQHKIYFNDMGLRNYALQNFSPFPERPDKGQLLENTVFGEILLSLTPFQKIRFWKTKAGAEVDFLLIQGEEILPIEVKTTLKKPQISKSLRNFIQKYSPAESCVVNLSIIHKKITIDKTQILFLHPYHLSPFLKSKRKKYP